MALADQMREMLAPLRARIQMRLARMGVRSDRDTVNEVCAAIGCLVREPDGLYLHMSPTPSDDYAAVSQDLEFAGEMFAQEVEALRAFVADCEQNQELQAMITADVERGGMTRQAAPHAIREIILAVFVDVEAEA